MKWYKRRTERYGAEMMLIRKYYPRARIFIKKGRLVIFLKVVGRMANYLAKIVYPDDFPFEPPKAYILEPRLTGDYQETHRYSDNSLCLATPDQVGPQTSGKVICDWVRRWVRAYEIWLNTGVFPGGD